MNKETTSAEIELAKMLDIDFSAMNTAARREAIFKAALVRIVAARALAKELDGLMSDSTGVAGYHLNGDVMDWGEMEFDHLIAKVIK